jgi:hypothetical protein
MDNAVTIPIINKKFGLKISLQNPFFNAVGIVLQRRAAETDKCCSKHAVLCHAVLHCARGCPVVEQGDGQRGDYTHHQQEVWAETIITTPFSKMQWALYCSGGPLKNDKCCSKHAALCHAVLHCARAVQLLSKVMDNAVTTPIINKKLELKMSSQNPHSLQWCGRCTAAAVPWKSDKCHFVHLVDMLFFKHAVCRAVLCRALLCRAVLCFCQLLSKVMDNAVTIPIINKKFGLDAVIGLIPYVGVCRLWVVIVFNDCPVKGWGWMMDAACSDRQHVKISSTSMAQVIFHPLHAHVAVLACRGHGWWDSRQIRHYSCFEIQLHSSTRSSTRIAQVFLCPSWPPACACCIFGEAYSSPMLAHHVSLCVACRGHGWCDSRHVHHHTRPEIQHAQAVGAAHDGQPGHRQLHRDYPFHRRYL